MPTVALVAYADEGITPAALSAAAGVLQMQVLQDLAKPPPYGWGISATVIACPDGRGIPGGSMPVYITSSVARPADYGYHIVNGSPCAYVQLSETHEQWLYWSSHEVLEMLADPTGAALQDGPSIDPQKLGSPARYLQEICDPVQNPTCGYSINNMLVSNFVLPAYYDSSASGLPLTARAASITQPLQLAPNGCITFADLQSASWMGLKFGDAAATNLGSMYGPPPGLSAEEADKFAGIAPRERVHLLFGRHLGDAALSTELLARLRTDRAAFEAVRLPEVEPTRQWLTRSSKTGRSER